MAHNLEIRNGIVSFVFKVGLNIWHKLGTAMDSISMEFLKGSFLNYPITKIPAYVKIDNQDVIVPNHYFTFREDIKEVFGEVSEQYEVIQNSQALNVIETLTNNHNTEYLTAAVLGKGERMFVTMKTPKNIVIAGSNDPINEHLILVNEHTGKESMYILFSPILPVCENTLNMALRSAKNKFTIQHKGSSVNELLNNPDLLRAKMAECMNIEDKYLQACETVYNKMAQTKYNINEFLCKSYINSKDIEKLEKIEQINQMENINWNWEREELTKKGNDIIPFQRKELIKSIVEYYNTDKFGQQLENRKGTVYGAFQAITGYYSNVADLEPIERIGSIYFGNAKDNCQKAFDFALTLS
jgi:phage/plasmid-like protein (TIGR03299 family)